MQVRTMLVGARTEFPVGHVVGRWEIAQRVRGRPVAGQYLAEDDEMRGAELQITLGPEQALPTLELLGALELRLTGVAPLRGIYGLTDAGGAVYHALVERIPAGAPLSRRSAPIAPDAAAPLAAQLARLVARAADASMALGVLRPEQVWVDERDGRVLLAGVTPRAEVFLRSARRPAAGAGVLFEDCYLPPEMLDGAPPSTAGDVFGAAACLVRALSGEHPFEGDTDPAQRLAIATGRRRTWRGPRALAAALESALDVRPQLRLYPDELVEAVDRALQRGV